MTTPPPPAFTTAHVPSSAPQVWPSGTLLGVRLANWPRRSVATLIDAALTVWLPDVLFGHAVSVWLSLLLVGFNSVFMEARTTQSFGKVIMNVHLVWPVVDRQGDNIAAKPSPLRCFLRMPLHLLDLIFAVGFLRPLWNARRQTFADSLTKTVVLAEALDFVRASSRSRSLL